MIRLVPASLVHVGPIALRMRDADAREALAFHSRRKDALRAGLRASAMTFTALRDGVPEAMMGVTPISAIEGTGRAWFLGTDAVLACARDLLELGPPVIEAMHRRFRRLENWVSTDNAPAIRMLGRWGFQLGDETMTVRGVEFRPFWREASDL